MSDNNLTSNFSAVPLTYTNPVYEGYLADPFIWKYFGVYYAIGTGAAEAAGDIDHPQTQSLVFPLLRSDNLVDWERMDNALVRPDSHLGDNFWAPEVAYNNGKFYLYYSVGHGDKNHQLRVAESVTPSGPYRDVGKSLSDPQSCPFAIDPHPFCDDDGQWYLFYARDFLDTEDEVRAGTALFVDKLQDMTTLSGEGKVVLRARSDWQRFLKDRLMYGKLFDWHTLEGPYVRKHSGRYYCFYSGGRWESDLYGVDYAVAELVMGPYSDVGNENGPRVLRSVNERVLGPGHNSIILGVDDRSEYIVYHAWDTKMTKRRMCLDKLIWTSQGPRSQGPTWTEQLLT
ncbi:glycoside hydrolase family 43 protein [Gloeothece verrucosa]|uniref:Glycoside hydrolase family 43 n=1 Tax=Gloeothece verrucosa (strain PCC 7822) TaxID=497965 RepID=E0ULI1_GLOV7|nr:glycoside hydrolase family 43 protein [Gloeothece verrucosa]ADN17811.1 glycoside hydrolase family 43 [Gloeothece verrucosa PCC 7822]